MTTEQEHFPLSLRELLSDEGLCDIVEEAPDAIILVDGAGIMAYTNHQAELTFGADRGDLVGRPIELLVPEVQRDAHRAHREAYLAAPTRRAMSERLDLRARRLDGSTFPVEVSLNEVAARGCGPYVLAVARDLTDRVRAEDDAHRADLALRLVASQERIARDLHDTVIQSLFGIGMSLQAAASLIPDPAVADRVLNAVDDLDAAIRSLRATVFTLHQPSPLSGGLRSQVAATIQEVSRSLGFTPSLSFVGAVEHAVPDDVAEHLFHCLREALANVAKHAHASRADVTLEVGSGVTLRVVDDGVGIGGDAVRGEGLANLEARAAQLGGRCVVRPGGVKGTIVEWWAPL